ncbi:hypothetical protein ACFFX0_23150 [Citricoccus parietis]|uniref:Uncharacterized protein n=1 Tax=Citricoccus parietis TaxID=592307 RepID=A0ABV5G4T1_9MICC
MEPKSLCVVSGSQDRRSATGPLLRSNFPSLDPLSTRCQIHRAGLFLRTEVLPSSLDRHQRFCLAAFPVPWCGFQPRVSRGSSPFRSGRTCLPRLGTREDNTQVLALCIIGRPPPLRGGIGGVSGSVEGTPWRAAGR